MDYNLRLVYPFAVLSLLIVYSLQHHNINLKLQIISMLMISDRSALLTKNYPKFSKIFKAEVKSQKSKVKSIYISGLLTV
ncbi:hypothetical protein FDUTEX481_08042 [Tolypothrix sp. PCC 7601]|nr:hypothetical protein FDUTEX481_08042 [Tolypothrix sp. PCC 7601]